ncbi:hypothetical protein RB594_006237 [Gaeumannomyces avenae]
MESANVVLKKDIPCAHLSDTLLNPKRLVICCDGTWNNSNDGKDPSTNVSRLASAVALGGRHDLQPRLPQPRRPRQPGGHLPRLLHLGRLGWRKKKRDDSKHLLGFSLDNYNPTCTLDEPGKDQQGADKNKKPRPPRPGRDPFGKSLAEAEAGTSAKAFAEQVESELATGLEARKDSLWAKIKKAENRSAIAKLYLEELAQQQLVLATKVPQENGGIKWVPVQGNVKAVGVWDTVGSLGVPKGPLRRDAGRSDNEIRFASLEMHANVQFAFHALAIDEYRTAFSPTLWQLPEGSKTVLRQVWFAGNHGDVGGGWADEQSANISLAWMADQLTSVGVEFSRPEFQRVFYDLASSSVPEQWSMGPIHSPPLKTSTLEVVGSVVKPDRSPDPRTPGLYCCDAPKEGWTEWLKRWATWQQKKKQPSLARSEERVHPSVRIRYQCGGQGPDGAGPYTCPALFKNGYILEKRIGKPKPRTANESPEEWRANRTHKTLGGNVVSHRDDVESAKLATLGPDARSIRVQQPVEEHHVVKLPETQTSWVWRHEAIVRGDGRPSELEEEQVGVWERLFIKTQEQLVEALVRSSQEALGGRRSKEAMAVTNAAYGAAGTVAGWFSGSKGATPKGKDVRDWGYHEIAVWLWGELERRTSSLRFSTLEQRDVDEQ